jgi:hypothetical protein
MKKIKWTRTYSLKSGARFFKVFMSEHNDGSFFGSVVYYDLLEKGQDTQLDLKMKTFIEMSEKDLHETVKGWVNENLKGDFVMKEDEYQEF